MIYNTENKLKKMEFIDQKWDWNTHCLKDFIDQGNLPTRWKEFFDRQDVREELYKISDEIQKVSKGCVIYPSLEQVFRAFYETPLDKVRVIIVGQDCYHNGNAVGLCFSVPKGREINPSLRNIYTELENEGYHPDKTGDLSHWAKQGCFMYNIALTVEKANPESHLGIWYNFSEKLLEYIRQKREGAVWLLMGKYASEFRTKNSIICSHPSPLSAYRPMKTFPAFIGSGVFRQINNFLQEKIKW